MRTTLPEGVFETARWLLVCGLAFYLADAADAGLEQRWVSEPVPFAASVMPPASSGSQAPPSLVKLLATTAPAALSEEPVAKGQLGAPAVPTKEGTIPVLLVGTMAGFDGAGVALLTVAGETSAFAGGQQLKDWHVVAVYRTSVQLQRNGERRTIELDAPTDLPSASVAVLQQPITAAKASLPPAPEPNPQATPAPESAATPAGPVEPLTSKRELVTILDSNPGDLSKQGSLRPVTRGTEIVGYQVKVKDPAFPLARLGILNGDIVLALNGVPADGPENLSKIYRGLRNTDTLKFEVERNGEKTTVQADLED